jgi:hypothetical protein
MKKFVKYFFALNVLSVFFSCTELDFNENVDIDSYKTGKISEGYNVTLQDARIYTNVVCNKESIELKNIDPIVYEKDTLAYIVNYDEGWEIVSGDKRSAAVLACDETGEFDLDDANPCVLSWLDDILGQIYLLRYYGKEDTLSDNYLYWAELTQKQVSFMSYKSTSLKSTSTIINLGHLTETKWGQNTPWNTCVPYTSPDYSERCPVGCVAVAGAQMLYFLHYELGTPSTMYSQGSCSGYSSSSSSNYSFNFSNRTTSAWDAMAKNYYASSGEDKSAILMGYVGYMVGMEYDEEGSGASTSDLKDDVFGPEGISCSYDSYDIYIQFYRV